jgi:hypothetical protein
VTMQGARPGWGKGPGRYIGWAVVGTAGMLVLTGCSALQSMDTTPNAQYGGICEDDRTGVRIDDKYCGDWDDDGLGYYPGGYGGYSGPTRTMWYPVDYGGDVPAVGQRVTTGAVRTVPKGAPVAKGVPPAGASAKTGGMGSITRGGFGVKAGTSGGSGAESAAGAGSGGKSGGS